jgi:hypothetical protein
MIEFARLAEFTGSVLQKVLTRRFIGAHWKKRFTRVCRSNAASDFDISGMVVFTRLSVFATAGSKEVSAVWLSWAERIGRFHLSLTYWCDAFNYSNIHLNGLKC